MFKRQHGVRGNTGHTVGHSIWKHSRSRVFNLGAQDELINSESRWDSCLVGMKACHHTCPLWPRLKTLTAVRAEKSSWNYTQVGSFAFQVKTCLCSFPPQTTSDCLFHSYLLSKRDSNKSTKVWKKREKGLNCFLCVSAKKTNSEHFKAANVCVCVCVNECIFIEGGQGCLIC